MIRIERGLPIEDLPQFRQIFFATSSRQKFESDEAREQFFEKWTGYYRNSEPDSLFVARDEGDRLLGYLTGCKDSRLAPPDPLWEDEFVRYPAHLHINCRPGSQGLGIGSQLMAHFFRFLREEGIRGVHIVTSPDAENKKFYSKNGFDFELIRSLKGQPLLFMGKDLPR